MRSIQRNGYGAMVGCHGTISHQPWNIRPFNRLVLEMHRLDSQSDRLVFQIDRRVSGGDRPADFRHSQDIGGEDALWAKNYVSKPKKLSMD
jgi:hypothetical protein